MIKQNQNFGVTITGGSIAVDNLAVGSSASISIDVSGTRLGGYIFISHVGDDKPLLAPLLNEMINREIPIWLDSPAQLGYSSEQIERYFHRIRPGQRWADEIDNAQSIANCTIVCWSKRALAEDFATKHSVFLEEASYARKVRRILCCMLELVSVTDLPANFSQLQVYDVCKPSELSLLVSDAEQFLRR